MSAAPSGVLVVDKPRGPTSHDIVARVRRALGTREVGHSGTLDPMATGVLVVAVGEATKLVPWLSGHDKTYEACIALGVETDTLDAEGREVARAPLPGALEEALAAGGAPLLEAAIAGERTRTQQVPPAFSAIHHEGRRAYAAARLGRPVDLAPRDVRVRELRLMSCTANPPGLAVTLTVAKGYYVRALGRDLARALGSIGHLTSLRRLASGPFRAGEAVPLDGPTGDLAAALQPLALAARRILPIVHLTDRGASDARHGRAVRPEDIEGATEEPSAWLDDQGELVAVGALDPTGSARVLRGFGGR